MKPSNLEVLLVPYRTIDLASITDIKPQHISRYRMGKVIPGADIVNELAWAVAVIQNDWSMPSDEAFEKVLQQFCHAVAEDRAYRRQLRTKRKKKGN